MSGTKPQELGNGVRAWHFPYILSQITWALINGWTYDRNKPSHMNIGELVYLKSSLCHLNCFVQIQLLLIYYNMSID